MRTACKLLFISGEKCIANCSVWCTDSEVNDPNPLLQVLTSLIYLHKFSFSSFPIRPYNLPIHLYMSTKHSTNSLQLFMWALMQSELWTILSSSRDVLGSHAVYLAPQLLLWTLFLVFPYFPFCTISSRSHLGITSLFLTSSLNLPSFK